MDVREKPVAEEDWIWSRYWHFDRIASCMDGPNHGNYADEVAAGWREFFRTLPNGAAVVDLCTGNGAVAVIAAQVGREGGKELRVTGVDQADIDPPRHVTRFAHEMRSIDFRGGVAAESLPFEDASFDAAVSQYGIEYSDLSRSLAEAARVLAPGGRLRFVMHAAEGVVCAGARGVVEDADFLLDEIDLPGRAARCFEAVIAVERNSSPPQSAYNAADAAFGAFGQALERAADYADKAQDREMIRNSCQVLLDAQGKRGYFRPEELTAKAEEVRTEIRAHRGRSVALVNAAVDEARLAQITATLAKAGVGDAALSKLRNREGLVAHVLEGRKALA